MIEKRMWIAALVVVALGWACPCARAADGTAKDSPKNLIKNGDFEKDAVGDLGGKIPSGWARPYGDAKPLVIEEDSRPGSEGDKCLKFDTNAKAKRTGVISKRIPLNPSLPLTVSLWMKDGGDLKVKRLPYVGVAWYDAKRKPIILKKGTTVNYRYVNFKKQADWQRISRTFGPFDAKEKDGMKQYYSIPKEVAFFELRIFVGNYPWSVWIDDVEVTQPKPKPPKTAATKEE